MAARAEKWSDNLSSRRLGTAGPALSAVAAGGRPGGLPDARSRGPPCRDRRSGQHRLPLPEHPGPAQGPAAAGGRCRRLYCGRRRRRPLQRFCSHRPSADGWRGRVRRGPAPLEPYPGPSPNGSGAGTVGADAGTSARPQGLDAEVARQWSLAREVENALSYATRPHHGGDLSHGPCGWQARSRGRTLPWLPAAHDLPAPGEAVGLAVVPSRGPRPGRMRTASTATSTSPSSVAELLTEIRSTSRPCQREPDIHTRPSAMIREVTARVVGVIAKARETCVYSTSLSTSRSPIPASVRRAAGHRRRGAHRSTTPLRPGTSTPPTPERPRPPRELRDELKRVRRPGGVAGSDNSGRTPKAARRAGVPHDHNAAVVRNVEGLVRVGRPRVSQVRARR